MARIEPFWRNYINGTWVTGAAGCIDVHDPATGQILAQQALADAGDVDRAVQAAKGVHLSGQLRDMRPIERGRKVQAMGRYLTQHRTEIAEILTLEQGKPLWESLIEVDGAQPVLIAFDVWGDVDHVVVGAHIAQQSHEAALVEFNKLFGNPSLIEHIHVQLLFEEIVSGYTSNMLFDERLSI